MLNPSLFDTQPQIKEHYSSDASLVLFAGDVNDFLAEIPDNSVKLIMTSPPYNLGKEYENRVAIEAYLERQAETIKELYRVLAEDGSICWQVGNFVQDGEVFPLDILYYPIFKNLGLHLRNRIIWHFGHGLHASKRLSGRYETILWFTKGKKYTFNLDDIRIPSKYPGKRYYKGPNKGKPSGNPKGKNPSDYWTIDFQEEEQRLIEEWEHLVWEIPNVKSNHPEKTIHPCQYPIELVERCVLATTNEGDWVLDPYAGVGSTLIGAIKRNRRAMGAEMDTRYSEFIRERIAAYLAGTLRIRPMGKPIYKPTGKEKISQIPIEWQSNDHHNKKADNLS